MAQCAENWEEGGVLMLNGDAIIWSMLNAIKELKAEVEALKAAR